MKTRIFFLTAVALIASDFQVCAELVTAEDKALIARICKNVSACEEQELKLLTAFRTTQARKPVVKQGPAPSQPSSVRASEEPVQSTPQTGHVGAAATKQDLGPALPTLSWLVPESIASKCQPSNQALFIRSDSLDNFNYADALVSSADTSSDSGQSPNAAAKGASVSYTGNRNSGTQTAPINARISYLLVSEQQCSPEAGKRRLRGSTQIIPGSGDTSQPFLWGLGFAPFVSADGTWNEPFASTTTTTKATSSKKSAAPVTTVAETNSGKTTTIVTTSKGTITTTTQKTSTSALRFGADFQVAFSTTDFMAGYLQDQYFYLSPFFQTDFRGLAQIDGVDVSWQPVSLPLHLGVAPTDEFYTLLWQFKAETELTRVENPGYTDFLTRGNHALVGEVTRVNLALFPLNSPVQLGDWFNNWIAGRLALIGTQQYYWDTATKQNAPYYSATLQYKLGACKRDSKTPVDEACAISGSSSISLEYDWGRDKDTYVNTNQLKVTLNYSY
jgi:hypothetical protein